MKYKLQDIVDVTMGQSPKSEFYNNDGEGVPFLQGNRTFGFKYPTFDTFTTMVTKEAKAGDVIMSVREIIIAEYILMTKDIEKVNS